MDKSVNIAQLTHMNIYQKLIEVRKMVDFLQKDTQGYQYRYVSGSNVLGSIRPKMDELGLILVTDIIEERQDRYQWSGKDNKGNAIEVIQFVTKIKMKMTWINAENPEEFVSQTWLSSGEDDDPAKANGKAHTYGERYYLLKFFNIPTDNEDPDAFQKKHGETNGRKESKLPPPPLPEEVTMLGIIRKTAKDRFGDPDKFKAWRVDNAFPEKLEGLSDRDLAPVLAKLQENKAMKRV